MKKLLAIVLAISMIFVFCACGDSASAPNAEDQTENAADTTEENENDTSAEEAKPENELAPLLAEGFMNWSASWTDEKWAGLYWKEGDFSTVYLVSVNWTAEEYEAFEKAGEDENSEELRNKILSTASSIEIKDVTYMVPTQEDLDQYIGKTLGDLEADGFENMGYSCWEEDGVYVFYYDGPEYSVDVDLKEGTVIEDMDDYSVNDLKALEIGKLSFTGLTSRALDEELGY